MRAFFSISPGMNVAAPRRRPADHVQHVPRSWARAFHALSADAGEPLFPIPSKRCAVVRGAYMETFGLNEDELYTVCTRNPARVVGLALHGNADKPFKVQRFKVQGGKWEVGTLNLEPGTFEPRATRAHLRPYPRPGFRLSPSLPRNVYLWLLRRNLRGAGIGPGDFVERGLDCLWTYSRRGSNTFNSVCKPRRRPYGR